MLTVSEKITTMLQTKYFGPAEVLDINEAERSVLLRFPGPAEELEAWARIAIPTSHHFAVGDRVLIAGEDAFNLYVIGLLEVKHEAGGDAQRVKTENGAYATVNKTRSRETVQVRSGSGELVFEYDPEHGKSRVNIYSGDLEFVTRDGDINFVSNGKII